MDRARSLRRAGGAASLVAGLLLVATGLARADGDHPETTTAVLHEAHVGATNPGWESGDCPAPPTEDATWGWHFVLTGSTTAFVSLEVHFEHEGTVTDFVSHPTAKHAYVFTSGPDVLLGATAQVDGPADRFLLSHVCAPDAVVPEPTVPEVPEPTVPEVPEPTVPEPTVPEPTVPEPTVPGSPGPEETTPEPQVVTTPTAGVLTGRADVPGAVDLRPQAAVARQGQLPRTGGAPMGLLVAGSLLVAFGASVLERSRRMA